MERMFKQPCTEPWEWLKIDFGPGAFVDGTVATTARRVIVNYFLLQQAVSVYHLGIGREANGDLYYIGMALQ